MKTNIKLSILAIFFNFVIFLNSCASIPKNTKAVENFNVDKYLGTWYEIARLDFSFEKDLNNVSAQYKLNEKGNIIVLNSGFNYVKKTWEKADGLAKFRGHKNIGALKVSFFGPFYSGYNVIALDQNYQYALVAGKNLNYLWILSRTKSIPEDIRSDYLKIAQQIGYDTSKLVWVEHDNTYNPHLTEN